MSGGRRKGLHVLGMAAVLRHWKNACLCGLLDVHQKVAHGVCCWVPCAGSIMPRLLQRSAKERLNLVWFYDETAGQKYRVTLLKGFELKDFLRFVVRMWLACAGRVDGSFLALRLCGAHLLDDLRNAIRIDQHRA